MDVDDVDTGGTAATLTPEQQRVLNGIDAVLAALPTRLPAIAVHGFLTTPNVDLPVSDRNANPLEWLIGGGDPATVVALAAELDLLP